MTLPYAGRLPADERSAAGRSEQVNAGDLGRASVLDVAGMSLVTSVVTLRYGLPDLVLEAASTAGIRPIRLDAGVRFFHPAGPEPVYLLPPDELPVLARFVHSARFVTADEKLGRAAFLHAVVVTHPGDTRPRDATEAEWVESKLWSAGLVRLSRDPERYTPDGVLLWSVGIERAVPGCTTPYWAARLTSGFFARVEVENRT